MIAGNIPVVSRTIPLYVYTELESPGGFENVYPLVLASIGISAVALMLSEVLERYGRERLRGAKP